MQISSRFTMAIHVFACIDTFGRDRKITSEFLSGSIHANPVIIRKLLSQLKAAGLISIKRGSGGASIARPPAEITLLDIYTAVECIEDGTLFHFHENPSQDCPVGRNIHRILDGKLQEVQKAMERSLQSITLQDILLDTKKVLSEN